MVWPMRSNAPWIAGVMPVTPADSAAAKVLGREPNVLFQAVAAGAETLADVDRKVREKQRKAAIDRAEQHPSVRTAAEILGARVKRVELGES